LLEWFRRSRKNGIWTDGVEGIPLNEDFEAYDLEFFDGTTLVKTITDHPTSSYLYSSAAQINDFGAMTNELTFKVYQKSVYVGRGYPLERDLLGVSRVV
jgi:hypothetical protein